MNSQQLLDYIIKPTLEYMEGNYNSKNAQMLLLATAAIESKCGYYIKQINGPALGIWQMEPATYDDIIDNCDAINENNIKYYNKIHNLWGFDNYGVVHALISHPMYACAMARLKYSMNTAPLPVYNDMHEIYEYYKRIYNTPLGASTFEKFKAAWYECNLDSIIL
jgi:hypothetical protein